MSETPASAGGEKLHPNLGPLAMDGIRYNRILTKEKGDASYRLSPARGRVQVSIYKGSAVDNTLHFQDRWNILDQIEFR